MDQARFFIIIAVLVSMMFALAILQRISRSSDDESGSNSSGGEVVAVRSSENRTISGTKDYTSLVNQNIPLASPNLACLETPNERDQAQKASEFSEQAKAVTNMLTYDKKLWSGEAGIRNEKETKN